jgi:hypothetical protein
MPKEVSTHMSGLFQSGEQEQVLINKEEKTQANMTFKEKVDEALKRIPSEENAQGMYDRAKELLDKYGSYEKLLEIAERAELDGENLDDLISDSYQHEKIVAIASTLSRTIH